MKQENWVLKHFWKLDMNNIGGGKNLIMYQDQVIIKFGKISLFLTHKEKKNMLNRTACMILHTAM